MPAERNPTKAEQAKYRRERKAAGICPKCDGKGSPNTWCPRCHNTGREKKLSKNDHIINFVMSFARKDCDMWYCSNCFARGNRRHRPCKPCQAKRIMGKL